jgi:hypothetical protein
LLKVLLLCHVFVLHSQLELHMQVCELSLQLRHINIHNARLRVCCVQLAALLLLGRCATTCGDTRREQERFGAGLCCCKRTCRLELRHGWAAVSVCAAVGWHTTANRMQ